MVVLSPDGIVLAVNQAFCDLYHIDRDATVGAHYMSFSGDLEIRRQGESVSHPGWISSRALRGETVRGVVQGVRDRAKGYEFFGRYGATPVIENGRFVATVVTVQDVTEVTRAAQQLDAVLAVAEVGTWRADLQTGRIWADANFARLCGLTPEEAQGGPISRCLEMVHPDDRERVQKALRHATEALSPHEVEYRILLPDGTVRWVVARGIVIRSETGEAAERIGSVVDITRQKTTEAALRRANEALEDAGRVATELSADLPLERIVQTITDASTKACEAQFGAFFYNVIDQAGESYMLYTISGVPKEEFSKFPMPRNTPIFAPTFEGTCNVRSDDITKDPRYGTMDPHHGMPKGHLPVRSYLAAPVRSRSGEVIGGLFYGHAETGRFTEAHEKLVDQYASLAAVGMDNARLYERVRGINDELERRVAERTEELTRANRDLNEFSYSVAHDLRAPLRAIAATSRILMEDAAGRLADEERRLLERQAKNAVRLGRIVDDLLAFARLSKAELRRERFDMTALTHRMADEVLERWNGVCALEVQEGMAAKGDPNLVGYALANLLDNACKFSPDGGTITVGERDGAYFVRDEGVGFDMRHASKLFVAFERLVDQEKFEGTGVGLANVKRIVERHGGRTWAESEPGHGATFWFTLG